MTSWIEDVVARIDSGSTAMTTGVNLFANVLPDDVRTVVTGVFERAGGRQDQVYGTAAAFERPSLLLITRSTAPIDGASAPSPVNARAEAWKAYRALTSVGNQALSTASARVFGAIEPGEAPYLFDVDEEGRHLFAFTAGAWVVPSTGSW